MMPTPKVTQYRRRKIIFDIKSPDGSPIVGRTLEKVWDDIRAYALDNAMVLIEKSIVIHPTEYTRLVMTCNAFSGVEPLHLETMELIAEKDPDAEYVSVADPSENGYNYTINLD